MSTLKRRNLGDTPRVRSEHAREMELLLKVLTLNRAGASPF